MKEKATEQTAIEEKAAEQTTTVWKSGFRDGIPIGLGYFAVAFSLGIAARDAGLNAWQGFIASLFTIASAGEYAAFRLIKEGGSYLEMALLVLVTNGRYLLMSCSLSQKVDEKIGPGHRIGIGFFVTDEIFGVSIAQPGKLRPSYTYGAAVASIPLWAIGTSCGIIAGNLLPEMVVTALSVSLYGMFLAIIIPPAKKNGAVALAVTVSFACSFASSYLPGIRNMSEGNRVILLTVVIAALAAILFPVSEEEDA
jgi:predicted branched-subunit amino acid permease